MPFCPVCHDEFREGMTHCATCDVDLVETFAQTHPHLDDASVVAYLRDKELAVLGESTVERLKPLQALLFSAGVPNIIVQDEEACGCGGGCGGHPKLQLVVAALDYDRAGEVLQQEFLKLVGDVADEEGMGGRLGHAIDIMAEQNICPACEATVPKGADACPECGLYVGVPAELLGDVGDEPEGGCGSCR